MGNPKYVALIAHELVRSNRTHWPDLRLRTPDERAQLPPIIDEIRRQLGSFQRHQTASETARALALDRALTLEDDRLTEKERGEWLAALDALAEEWGAIEPRS